MTENNQAKGTGPRLRYGMVGGGAGGFIGAVHRKAIAFDAQAELVCGCFSTDPANTLQTGLALGLQRHRLYDGFEEMAAVEGQSDDPIDFVVIVTPNFTHYPIARAFLENGIHVVCDKPFTLTSGQAEELRSLARERGLSICLTYTYTGYPLAKQARQMIKNGDLGEIRFVNAEYPQDWLSSLVEATDHKQAGWRADPAKSGPTNCVGDVGSHIENMVSYMTGLKIQRLSARLDTLVKGRRLDDNATIMVDYHGGAKGLYWCSQVAVGNDNGFRVRIFGSKASIDWAQENPNSMKVAYPDEPARIVTRGRDILYPQAQRFSRIPAGHPEGYFEAFANVYQSFLSFLLKKRQGQPVLPEDTDFPQAEQGIQGVLFIEKCVESSQHNGQWVTVDKGI